MARGSAILWMRVHPTVTKKCCRIHLPTKARSMKESFKCPECGMLYLIIKSYDVFWVKYNSMLAKAQHGDQYV